MQEKSVSLMVGIVKFLNSAIIYLNQTFFGIIPTSRLIYVVNLVKTVAQGGQMYADGKQALEVAIKEYDQAVVDLTASVLASNPINGILLTSRPQI